MFQKPRTTFVLYSALQLAKKLVSICSFTPLKQLLLPDYDLYIDRVNFSYPRIPLPELKDSDKLDKIMNMKEATKKIRLGPENLPSICFYSFLNAYQVSHAWIWILNVWMTTLLVFKYNLISMLTKPYSFFLWWTQCYQREASKASLFNIVNKTFIHSITSKQCGNMQYSVLTFDL